MRIRFMAQALVLMVSLFPALAAAGDDPAFVPLPVQDGRRSELKLRVVTYTGGVNGRMEVDIRNPSQQVQTFQARGLFFVPEGDPEKAPQRLGAAGPFQVQDGQDWTERENLTMRPGETRRIRLQVFCLDSHRSSPGAGQGFKMAGDRLPKHLSESIHKEAQKALVENGGSIDSAKSAIQGKVWESRNKEWIKLEGERKNEKAPVQGPRHLQRLNDSNRQQQILEQRPQQAQ